MHSSELLQTLAEGGGSYLVDQLGCPHTDLKARAIAVHRADGQLVTILDGVKGGLMLDDFIRASLIYEAEPLDEQFRRVYRLTPDGLARSADGEEWSHAEVLGRLNR